MMVKKRTRRVTETFPLSFYLLNMEYSLKMEFASEISLE